jgi:hypothetical protein
MSFLLVLSGFVYSEDRYVLDITKDGLKNEFVTVHNYIHDGQVLVKEFDNKKVVVNNVSAAGFCTYVSVNDK